MNGRTPYLPSLPRPDEVVDPDEPGSETYDMTPPAVLLARERLEAGATCPADCWVGGRQPEHADVQFLTANSDPGPLAYPDVVAAVIGDLRTLVRCGWKPEDLPIGDIAECYECKPIHTERIARCLFPRPELPEEVAGWDSETR